MAGPGGQVHKGWRRHMRRARESSWGVAPVSPEWRCIPIEAGGMGLKAAASLFCPDTSYGGWKRTLVLPELQEVAGSVGTLAWPGLTRYLLDAALERESDPASPRYQDLRSYCVDFYTPPDPRRYLGAVVEGLEIRAAPSAVRLLLRLRAWKEVENDALSEDDFDYAGVTPVPFALRRATLALAGSDLTDVEGFCVTVDNAVQAGRSAGGYVAWLAAGPRSVVLDLTKLDNADEFNAAIRTGSTLSFNAVFAHPAGQEMSLQLPVLHAEKSSEEAPPARLARSRARLHAAADEFGRDIVYEVSSLPTTTTTTTPS